jgi:hypothetical protein
MLPRRWVNLTSLFGFFSLPLLCQTSGSILGTVLDNTGAGVGDAKVTIVNVDRGTTQAVTTDPSGDYNVPFLPPGNYRVTVEKSGFKKQQSAPTKLDVDQRARIDFTLELGSVTEVIEVTAAAPLVRSETSELGEVITERAVRELPLNGRNFAQLVYLVPGVTPGQSGENLSGASTFNPRAASNFNALGSQANANAWLVDGISDNEYTFNTVMVQPSVESIQEFKVLTGTFSSEYGRGAGVVTTQTKSGSNQFHGSAFEFLRNNYFDARNYFNAIPQPQPPYRRNQYGASVGGPIVKNKLFFFADYYGQREIKGQTFINTVPTALERTGNFSDIPGLQIYNPFTTRSTTDASGKTVIVRDPFQGNIIPSNLLNPVALNVANLYPLPNLSGVQNNRVDVFNRDLTDNGGNVRVDYTIRERDSLFGRYSYERFQLFDTKGQSGCCIPTPADAASKFDLGPFISGGQNTTLNASGLAINETHVFSPAIVNEFVAGYSRTQPYTTQSDFGHESATSLGIQGINVTEFATGLPTINIPGTPGSNDYTTINGGPGFLPARPRQTSYQLGDTVAWTIGNHQTKFGYRGVQNQVSPFTNTDTRSTLNFGRNFTNNPVNNQGGNGLATLLLGYLTNGSSAAASRGFLREPYYLTNYEHGLFFQDDWKVRRGFTLNLGLRWDLFTPATEKQNRITNFDLADLTMIYAGVNGTSDTANIQTQYKNFAPRVGFAWDVTGNGKTVVRSGFAMAYFPMQGSASNIIGQAVPWTISQNTVATDLYPTTMNGPQIQNPFPTPVPVMPMTTAELIATNPRVLGYQFENQTPYYESWSFNVERQIGQSMVAEVAYAGSHGVHLLYCYNPQEVLPGPATVPTSQRITIPEIASVRNILQCEYRNSSSYNGLQGKLTKRLSNGLQFLFSYTYSKSLDYGGSAASGGGSTGGPQTITDINAGRGPSGFDMRHRFVGSWVYELPFGPGKKYWNQKNWATYAFGGWEIDGIVTLSTGRPFNVSLANGVTNGAPSWPDRIASGMLDNPTRAKWFDPTAFAAPDTPRYGNVGRGILYAPGTNQFDLSAVKNFAITERFRLQFRADAFNAFNHPQFGFPASSIKVNPVTHQGTADTFTGITSTIADNRDLQLALKLTF